MKTKILFVIAIMIVGTAFVLFACTKISGPNSGCQFSEVPFSLILEFRKGGVVLGDSILSGAKLSYFDGGNKKYVPDFTISNLDSGYQKKGLITSREVGFLSGDGNIKTYYLEYPNGWTKDTLYIDYLTRSPATNCVYVEKPPKFNGKVAPVDSVYDFDSPVYILNKQ
jgi:hypothetical protein